MEAEEASLELKRCLVGTSLHATVASLRRSAGPLTVAVALSAQPIVLIGGIICSHRRLSNEGLSNTPFFCPTGLSNVHWPVYGAPLLVRGQAVRVLHSLATTEIASAWRRRDRKLGSLARQALR
jgi:hypothetical protein